MKGRSGSPPTSSGKAVNTVANAINALEKTLLTAVKDGGKPLGAKEIHAVVRAFKAKPQSSAPLGAPPSAGFTKLLIAPFADVIDDSVEVSREAIPRGMIPAFEKAVLA